MGSVLSCRCTRRRARNAGVQRTGQQFDIWYRSPSVLSWISYMLQACRRHTYEQAEETLSWRASINFEGPNFLKRLAQRHSASWRRITTKQNFQPKSLSCRRLFAPSTKQSTSTSMTLDPSLLIISSSSLMALHLKIDSVSQIALLKDHG